MTAAEQSSPKAPGVKIAVMASAGSAIEWYDFFLYGTAAALIFPTLFFPADLPPFVAQIAAFSTFAVGFIARPIGGMIFGHYGDLHGRKRALVFAMLLMGVATTLIGLLPSYETAGVIAPLLLVALRFVQGLAVGGQWGGAALLAIESAPPNKRGYYGSLVQIGAPLGVVLANTVFLINSAIFPAEQFVDWGWRIGFLFSVVLIIMSIYIHVRVVEPAVDQANAIAPSEAEPVRPASPLITVLRDHWRAVVLAGGTFVANNVFFYIAITYAMAHGTTALGLSRETMLFAVMAGTLAMIPVLILSGILSDRFGRRGIFMLGAVLCGFWVFALFPMMETRSPVMVTAAISISLMFVALMYGPQAALFAELFPKEVRYSGASLGYQIGTLAGGGFAPIIATALYAHTQSANSIAIYVAATCAISFFSVILLGRLSRKGHHA